MLTLVVHISTLQLRYHSPVAIKYCLYHFRWMKQANWNVHTGIILCRKLWWLQLSMLLELRWTELKISCLAFFVCSIGSGSWITDGITITSNLTVGNVTSVQCHSTHLTSFAVLVDVAGGLQVCCECHNIWQKLSVAVSSFMWEIFFGRIYPKWSAKPCRLFHTLAAPFLQSALSFL